uniref:Uncharacterized protein n=1 Tax=Meloidogyne javanica TaxID=6303 RepID=A0A915M811_MELJA
MHYIVNIVKANDRKFILANRELSEDEWKGKTNIDVELTKYKVISYIRTSKHYPMVISVKAHFVHKKCANKRIRKNASLHYYRKKRQALLESVKEDEGEGKESPSSSAPPTNADKIENEEGDPLPPPPLPNTTPPHHLPSCSSSSSLSTCSHGSPTTQLEVASSSSHLPPQETNTDKENITKANFEDKCPVIGCNKVVFMKKNSSGNLRWVLCLKFDPEISEQPTGNVQGEGSKGLEESVENPENRDPDSQINTENQENSEIKNKEEESSKKGKEPIEQIPEKGEGSTNTNLETNDNKPETINVSYEKSTSSESSSESGSESEYVIYKNEKLKIHREKKPCDDFYKYVCDGFDRKNIPRTDCSEISTTASRRQQTQKILEDLLANPLPLNPNLPQNLIQKLYGFHSACIQSPNKLTQSSDVILSKLNILTQKGNNNKRLFDTDWALKAFPINREELLATRYGMIIQNLLEDDVWYSLKQNIQPVLLPSNNLFKGEIIPNCNGTQVKELILSEAERRVRNLFKVENKLAKQLDFNSIYDSGPSGSKNYLKLSQLDTPNAFISAFNWTKFVQNLLSPVGLVVDSQTEIHLSDPSFLQRMGKIIGEFSEQEISDYLDWNTLWTFMPQMDKRYTLHYVNSKPPKDNPWLDTITRGKALTKLQMLQANAVYFERIFDNNYLEGIYGHYNPLRTDVPFAEMVHTFEGASFLRQMATNDYYDSSWLVNAYYSRETNALVSLNGYLNPPIFSKDFLAVMNYAGIGVTLGHELSHAFDDWGSYYNGNGQMEDWLGPQMRAIFQKKKECFVKQYGNSKRQCSRLGSTWLRQRIMTEQHSVVPARVNIPLQNSPHFAKIFACPSGSPMNPIEKCAIW